MSGFVAFMATSALFVAAVVGMTGRRMTPMTFPSVLDQTTMVRLIPPPPAPVERPKARVPDRRQPLPARTSTAPATVPSEVPDVPVPIAELPRDSSTIAAPFSRTLIAPPLPTAALPNELAPPAEAPARTNTAAAPAGVTRPATVLSKATRDSMAARMALAFFEALHRQPTPDEVEAMKRQRDPGGSPAEGGHSANAPGLGAGMSVGVPFGVPILNAGPSAAQRARDAAIDAENRSRVQRNLERIAVRRDSIRADSLRRDSLARVRPD